MLNVRVLTTLEQEDSDLVPSASAVRSPCLSCVTRFNQNESRQNAFIVTNIRSGDRAAIAQPTPECQSGCYSERTIVRSRVLRVAENVLSKLRLRNFKSFRDAELTLGPFTLLVGTNASGKSNIRDAIRFLHGLSRGYAIADIIGEKYGDGGFLQWSGIRGGFREITFQNEASFALEMSFLYRDRDRDYFLEGTYEIAADPGIENQEARILTEAISSNEIGREPFIPPLVPTGQSDISLLLALGRAVTATTTNLGREQEISKINFDDHMLLLGKCMNTIQYVRFLDPALDAMRKPSKQGQAVLGDRGENLSSVLYQICKDESRKQALLDWIAALTPSEGFLTDTSQEKRSRLTRGSLSSDRRFPLQIILKLASVVVAEGRIRQLVARKSFRFQDLARVARLRGSLHFDLNQNTNRMQARIAIASGIDSN